MRRRDRGPDAFHQIPVTFASPKSKCTPTPEDSPFSGSNMKKFLLSTALPSIIIVATLATKLKVESGNFGGVFWF
jgi:hypothetical protein